MSEKKIDKVCIDCINANEHLKISSDFKVSVEYGTCDCCGKRYIVVPFRRFFSENIKITPCTEGKECGNIPLDSCEQSKKKDEQLELIRELQNKVGALEKLIGKDLEKSQWQLEIEKRLIELEPKPVDLGEPTKEEKKDKKQKDLDKVYE